MFVERTEKRTDSENNECSLPPFSRTRILPTEHSFFRRFWKSPAMRLKVYMSLYASLPARWAGKTSGILCCIGVRLQKRQRRLCTSNRVALQQVAYGTSRKGAINRVRVDTLCAFPWLALSVCVFVCVRVAEARALYPSGKSQRFQSLRGAVKKNAAFLRKACACLSAWSNN